MTPLIYSRFEIIWPDALNLTEPRTGVDALTYGLATLVMREDLFENAMLETKYVSHGTCQSFACKDCGHVNYVDKTKPLMTGRLRRGNFFSQFVKKFSLGVCESLISAILLGDCTSQKKSDQECTDRCCATNLNHRSYPKGHKYRYTNGRIADPRMIGRT